MNQTGYDIIYDQDLDDLIRKVREAIIEGWRCQGGIAVSVMKRYTDGEENGMMAWFYQAMVKIEDLDITQ